MRGKPLRGLVEAVKSVARPETIEDLPVRHIDPFRRDLLSWLFGREPLPRDEMPAPPRRPPLLSLLFGAEALPEPGGAPGPGRTAFLTTLFAGEDLPLDETPVKAGGRGAAPPARNQRAG